MNANLSSNVNKQNAQIVCKISNKRDNQMDNRIHKIHDKLNSFMTKNMNGKTEETKPNDM